MTVRCELFGMSKNPNGGFPCLISMEMLDDLMQNGSITLVWQRLTDKVTCRVKDEREYLCFDIEDKTEVFAFLKDASDRMSVIFHNYILEYKE